MLLTVEPMDGVLFRSAVLFRQLPLCRHVHRSSGSAFRKLARFISTDPKEKWLMQAPFTIDIPVVPFTKYIYDAQEAHADRIAFVNGITDETITHGEFRDLSTRLGSALTRLDVTKGDVVAIVSPNCPEFAISFFAVSSIGAINTTINCTYTADEIALQISNSGASVVITHPLLLPTVKAACQKSDGIRHIITSGPSNESFVTIQELLKDDGTAFPQNVKVDPKEDLVVLPYSSGTTGLPKGVMLTHYNMVSNMQQIMHPFYNVIKPGPTPEILIGVLPFFHIYGMVVCMGLSLYTGAKMVTVPTFEPNLYVGMIKKHQATLLHTVPPIVGFLVNSELATPELLNSVHTVACGAAPLGPALVNRFQAKFGERIKFQEGYGMTEASPVTHITPLDDYHPGSTGLLVPNTKAKIIDISTGETVGPGVEGELCIHGPQVMKGYYKNEKATKETIQEDGWLHTGDIAKIDEKNNLYIVDRLKELIKVKGLQVAPAELEDLIRKHPNISDVAVIGLPDERAGEVPRAYVVVSPGSDLTEEAVASYVAKEVAPHKRLLGGVCFTDRIPKSSTGKILRRELKAVALKST